MDKCENTRDRARVKIDDQNPFRMSWEHLSESDGGVCDEAQGRGGGRRGAV